MVTKMTDKEYDKILTDGVRWLALLHSYHPEMGIKYKVWDDDTKFFFELARMYSVYYDNLYIKCSLLRYMWLRWVKKYSFLRRPPHADVFYIEPDGFLKEMSEACKIPSTTFAEIYNYYWGDYHN